MIWLYIIMKEVLNASDMASESGRTLTGLTKKMKGQLAESRYLEPI